MTGHFRINALNVDLNLMKQNNFNGWLLSDLKTIKQNNFKVFSTFACGGGSSMGYKLAGFTMEGANDIDPVMRKHYEKNLQPKLFIEKPVKELLNMDLPKELFDLDILDGSPPCSSFSMAGNREKDWGKKKYFKEGQSKQVLDDLFFDFIALGKKLQPKVIVAENVKGLISGNAKGYCRLIFKELREAGYKPQMFLINAAYCGVPQLRERVFIIAQRNDLNKPLLQIQTNKTTISVKEAFENIDDLNVEKHYLSGKTEKYWHLTKPGKNFSTTTEKLIGKSSWFNSSVLHPNKPSNTITASCQSYHWEEPRRLTENEYKRLASFPDDYHFYNYSMASYLTGMSVPPKMMQLIAEAIRDQWLND